MTEINPYSNPVGKTHHLAIVILLILKWGVNMPKADFTPIGSSPEKFNPIPLLRFDRQYSSIFPSVYVEHGIRLWLSAIVRRVDKTPPE